MKNYKMNSLKNGLTIKIHKTREKNIFEARVIFRLGDIQSVTFKHTEAYSYAEAKKIFREQFKDLIEAFSFDYSDLNHIDDRHYIYGSGKQVRWNSCNCKAVADMKDVEKYDEKLRLDYQKKLKKLQGGGR